MANGQDGSGTINAVVSLLIQYKFRSIANIIARQTGGLVY